MMFRGPKKDLSDPYIVFLGGAETYGKFVKDPFPDLLEARFGITSVNLGTPGAGVDSFRKDNTVKQLCGNALCTIIQAGGAHDLTNPYYSVHPRRNDRFIKIYPPLRDLFPGIDVTEVAFTRHLHHALVRANPLKHAMIIGALKQVWVKRMKAFVRRLDCPTVLLWYRTSSYATAGDVAGYLGKDPLFVDSTMVSTLIPHLTNIVEFEASVDAQHHNLEGMVFSDLEAPIAAELPGPEIHQEIAEKIAQSLNGFLKPV